MLVLVGAIASVGGGGPVTPATSVSVGVDVGTIVGVDVGIFGSSFPPPEYSVLVLVGEDVGLGCGGPAVVSVGGVVGDAGAVAVEVEANKVGVGANKVGVGAGGVGVGVVSQAELPPQIPRQSTTLPLLQIPSQPIIPPEQQLKLEPPHIPRQSML